MVLVFGSITIVVSVKVYFANKKTSGGTVETVGKSMIISMGLYVILTCIVSFLYDRSGMGWLIVVVPFMIIFTAPMALSVSLGTNRILTDIEREQKSVSTQQR